MENRILLLEDDVSLIDGLQYSLKKNGFDVDFVRSVQETLTYLSEMSMIHSSMQQNKNQMKDKCMKRSMPYIAMERTTFLSGRSRFPCIW